MVFDPIEVIPKDRPRRRRIPPHLHGVRRRRQSSSTLAWTLGFYRTDTTGSYIELGVESLSRASRSWKSPTGKRCTEGKDSVNPDDLIRIAEHLASGGVGGGIGRPVQAELRRAVSATYYALFHALARCCANMLVGVATPASRSQQAWTQVYRALEHGHAKNQCCKLEDKLSRFPQTDTGIRAIQSSKCNAIVKKPTTIPNARFFQI